MPIALSKQHYNPQTYSLSNIYSLLLSRTACTDLINEHGDTVGVKRGKLQLISRDLDILKHVMVKDFNNFVDRITVLNTNSLISKGLFFLQGDDWRRVRHVLSPSFS